MSNPYNNGIGRDYGNNTLSDNYEGEHVEHEWQQLCEYESNVNLLQNVTPDNYNHLPHYQVNQNYIEENPIFVYDNTLYPLQPAVGNQETYAINDSIMDRQVPSAGAALMPFDNNPPEDFGHFFEDNDLGWYEEAAPIFFDGHNQPPIPEDYYIVNDGSNNWSQDLVNLDYGENGFQGDLQHPYVYPTAAAADVNVINTADISNPTLPSAYANQNLPPVYEPLIPVADQPLMDLVINVGTEDAANPPNPVAPIKMPQSEEKNKKLGRKRQFTDEEREERRLIAANKSYHKRKAENEDERFFHEVEAMVLETENRNLNGKLNDVMNEYQQLLNNNYRNLSEEQRKYCDDKYRKSFD